MVERVQVGVPFSLFVFVDDIQNSAIKDGYLVRIWISFPDIISLVGKMKGFWRYERVCCFVVTRGNIVSRSFEQDFPEYLFTLMHTGRCGEVREHDFSFSFVVVPVGFVEVGESSIVGWVEI